MQRAEVSRRPAMPDLDPNGRCHPGFLMRLAQEAVTEAQRACGVLHDLAPVTRVTQWHLDSTATAGRDDELTATASVATVDDTTVDYAFSIETQDGQIAEGRIVECYTDGTTDEAKPIPDQVRTRLRGSAQ